MRIYLLGYMGSGKSTLGRRLAHELGISWIDTDDEFETRYKIGITDFFSKYGENAFRELEQKLLADFSKASDVVISTGGGMPCFFDNMELMNQTGFTVYLKATPELLISRNEISARKRPLFQQMKGENFLQDFTQHLKLREPFYEKAKLILDSSNPDIKELKSKILDYFSLPS